MAFNLEYDQTIKSHYTNIWSDKFEEEFWNKGPLNELSPLFKILVFPPTKVRKMWTYATSGMSSLEMDHRIELHLFSPYQDSSLVELLTSIAHYHRNGNALHLNDTVNFGRAWIGMSKCDHGFISLPYLDGPDLENHSLQNKEIKFYWLIPISKEEIQFKKKYGTDALEDKFDQVGLNYLDPNRKMVV